MPECKYLDSCRMMAELLKVAPGLAGDYRENFCEGDFSKCARHMVAIALGPDKVPLDLFPTEASRASEVIEGINEFLDQ